MHIERNGLICFHGIHAYTSELDVPTTTRSLKTSSPQSRAL